MCAGELLINADARVSHGLVVRCMDAARAAGIAHFSIATQGSE
ncbi:MAG: biopolymer transporter ExbD [Armatimonadetes bacterium]|nr:biopolymer transporter ExbD [Armatimonadota bacterium]